MKTNTGAILVPAPTPSTTTNAAVDKDIRDIKGPVDIPVGWVWLAWVLGVLAAATAAFLLLRRWLRKRRAATAPEVVIPAHIRARGRLNAALQLLYDPKPFCTEVSDTVRLYLEERFEYRAPERTTDEFLDELQSSSWLSLTHKQSLADFLSRCDLVKFAKYEPTETELRSLHGSALRLVEETAPYAMAGPGRTPPLTRPSDTLSPNGVGGASVLTSPEPVKIELDGSLALPTSSVPTHALPSESQGSHEPTPHPSPLPVGRREGARTAGEGEVPSGETAEAKAGESISKLQTPGEVKPPRGQ